MFRVKPLCEGGMGNNALGMPAGKTSEVRATIKQISCTVHFTVCTIRRWQIIKIRESMRMKTIPLDDGKGDGVLVKAVGATVTATVALAHLAQHVLLTFEFCSCLTLPFVHVFPFRENNTDDVCHASYTSSYVSTAGLPLEVTSSSETFSILLLTWRCP